MCEVCSMKISLSYGVKLKVITAKIAKLRQFSLLALFTKQESCLSHKKWHSIHITQHGNFQIQFFQNIVMVTHEFDSIIGKIRTSSSCWYTDHVWTAKNTITTVC